MKKFLSVEAPQAEVTVTNSGTTTAGTADKLTDTGGTPNFTSTVAVGDIIVSGDITYVVTAVDSDSVLSVTGGGVPTTTAYTIYSGASVGAVLFPVDSFSHIDFVNSTTSELILKLSNDNSSFDTVTIVHQPVANNYVAGRIIQDAVLEVLSRKWTTVSKGVDFGVTVGSVRVS